MHAWLLLLSLTRGKAEFGEKDVLSNLDLVLWKYTAVVSLETKQEMKCRLRSHAHGKTIPMSTNRPNKCHELVTLEYFARY